MSSVYNFDTENRKRRAVSRNLYTRIPCLVIALLTKQGQVIKWSKQRRLQPEVGGQFTLRYETDLNKVEKKTQTSRSH